MTGESEGAAEPAVALIDAPREARDSAVDWPSALVKELADRRAILVLGSGLSATAHGDGGRTPPTWGGLISQLCRASVPSADQGAINAMIEQSAFVEAAEEVVSRADKQSLAAAFRSALVDPHFKASQAHSDVMTVDQAIVVNLNYDRIYENRCIQLDGDSYVVTHYYGADFIRNIRSPLRVILKLHGSIDDPGQTVFSMTDYTAARRDHAATFEVLQALLLTRTVLFIGCGFNGDPDVEFLLSENALRHPGSYPHYALISDQGDEKAFAKAKREGLNIKFIQYSVATDSDGKRDHGAFSAALSELKDLVLDERQGSV